MFFVFEFLIFSIKYDKWREKIVIKSEYLIQMKNKLTLICKFFQTVGIFIWKI